MVRPMIGTHRHGVLCPELTMVDTDNTRDLISDHLSMQSCKLIVQRVCTTLKDNCRLDGQD